MAILSSSERFSAAIERAEERVDQLQAAIAGFNGEPIRCDLPANEVDGADQPIIRTMTIKKITRFAERAVSAIVDALRVLRGRVDKRKTGSPPEWWREVGAVAARERLKNTTSQSAFLDAFDILDRHINDDEFNLACLVMISGDLDGKIEAVAAAKSEGLSCHPNPKYLLLAFDPRVNADTYPVFNKLILERFPYASGCVGYLRNVIEDIEMLHDSARKG